MGDKGSENGGLSKGDHALAIILTILFCLIVLIPQNFNSCRINPYWGLPVNVESHVDWMTDGCDLSTAKNVVTYSPNLSKIVVDLMLICIYLFVRGILKEYPRQRTMKFLANISIVVVICSSIIYFIGGLDVGCVGPMHATGFPKVKPQLAGCGFFSNGNTRCIFTNYKVGSTIEVVGGSVRDPKERYCCKLNLVDPSGFMVNPGENFELSGGPECVKPGERGKTNAPLICVDYRVQGKIQQHECGTIYGPYE
jgi:hypothetical protein